MLLNNSLNDELGEKKQEPIHIWLHLYHIYTIYNNHCYNSPSFLCVCLFGGGFFVCLGFCFALGFVGLFGWFCFIFHCCFWGFFCWFDFLLGCYYWLVGSFIPFLFGLIFSVGRKGNGYKLISSVCNKL